MIELDEIARKLRSFASLSFTDQWPRR